MKSPTCPRCNHLAEEHSVIAGCNATDKDGDFCQCPAGEDKVYRIALQTENEQLERMILCLFDAHYGMAYHHCGDGDGISAEDAAEIVAFVRSKWEAE